MDQAIQKATGGPLTFQKQPERFLAEVGDYLETIQLVYRSKLPQQELVLWRETLKDYSYQEFNQAMTHLISNPPKYELEDGSIQVWRGMPKLPDVVDVMLDLREKAVQDAQQRERDERAAEFKRLEQRRKDHPEEFFGWADVLKAANLTDAKQAAKPMHNVKTIWPDIDPNKNAEKLRQQAEKLNRKQDSTSHGTHTAETS